MTHAHYEEVVPWNNEDSPEKSCFSIFVPQDPTEISKERLIDELLVNAEVVHL